MEPTVIMWTGENLGKFTLNADQRQITKDLFNSLWKVFWANGNRWKLLIIFIVILLFARLKARDNRKSWKNKEREKARIWKEEYKE